MEGCEELVREVMDAADDVFLFVSLSPQVAGRRA
jgi:hypothetical protein